MSDQRCITIELPKKRFNGIMFVGEAPGRDEEIQGRPFVGASGRKLNEWLKETGIKRKRSIVTNVFHIRPEGNKISLFFISSKMAVEQEIEYCTKYPPCNGGYLYSPYHKEMSRLRLEIKEHRPAVIVTLGGVALWALTGLGGISQHVGKTQSCTLVKNKIKVVPAFHPAYVFRTHSEKIRSQTLDALRLAKKLAEKSHGLVAVDSEG